jgi:predicted transglutaminase-like protease
MPEFTFYIDQKTTVWERSKYVIEAESYEEAVAKATEIFKDDELQDEEHGFIEQETLYDTIENMTPKENDNQSTMELIYVNNGEDKTILDNHIPPIQNSHVGD